MVVFETNNKIKTNLSTLSDNNFLMNFPCFSQSLETLEIENSLEHLTTILKLSVVINAIST